MKEFILKKGLKVVDKKYNEIYEIYEWDGYWYLATEKSLFNINQFNPEDFDIYVEEKLTFSELGKIIWEHNEKNNVKSQYQDKNALMCVVVIDNKSFDTEYPLESRSYLFRSDNKYFLSSMGGNSIYCNSLDETDTGVRLDWYLGEWQIEYCYIINNEEKKENK